MIIFPVLFKFMTEFDDFFFFFNKMAFRLVSTADSMSLELLTY